MRKSSKNRIAILFTIVFMALISAPVIIMSIDDSIDTTCFFSINEEEENAHAKLLFDKEDQTSEFLFEDQTSTNLIGYTFKQYPKPHLNLISPPPDFI
ncbi:hypothetical protein DFQ10_103229 [Winogradskyella eximia]|jgi:hypothetical protein|uniref:Uncharacterized protein n=1 Tax=Winogradskyella eximia TaxID=262006 RepID=A0A3D9H505_9FLAO|nr:hypothetical protein [Winogradskyella eximia]RED44542.1 hypothetical protein DFQ10_103229 [Winogradskyella eximia]|tara:strand:- start:15381 stop:15674 length:294 start_codon:yes stop_codon:yes gene_type:complete